MNKQSNMTENAMRTLRPSSLRDELMQMSVGESCYKPDEYSIYSIRVECSRLKREGYVYMVNTREGRVIVTRLR